MNKNKRTLYLVLILAVIAVLLVLQNRKGTLSEKGQFAVEDTASVTKIFLADKRDNMVLLAKDSSGIWQLNDTLKARQEAVNILLKTMKGLAVKAPVSKNSYNNVITRLAANSVKVEVYQNVFRIDLFDKIKLFQHEKLTKVYYVGHPTPDNMGTFMMIEGSDTPFVVYLPGLRGYVSARYSAIPGDWRDHTIFRTPPDDVKFIKLEFPSEPAESFLLEKEGRSTIRITQLSSGKILERFDTASVVQFVSAYKFIAFESPLDAMEPKVMDSVRGSKPAHIITVGDVSGKVKSIKTFRRPNYDKQEDLDGNIYPWDINRMYALIDDDREMVLVQYFVFDEITRPLSYFLK